MLMTSVQDRHSDTWELQNLLSMNANDDTPPASPTPDSTIKPDKKERLTLVQAIRKYPKISAWSLAISSGIILTGFDTNVIAAVASLSEFQ